MKLFTILGKAFLAFITFVFMALLISSCGKNKAVGNEDEIFVVADSAEYVELEGELFQVFSKVIYTPQPENKFILIPKKLSELGKLKKKKNLIIIAPLNSGSDVSNYISKMLDSASQKIIGMDSAFVINKHDLWYKNQLVMILSSPSIPLLKKNLLIEQENLLYAFQKISNKRLFASLYKPAYEKMKIEAELLRDYGWIIYVQADFLLALNKPENNFVWLRRAVNTNMERWVFVHWIENASPEFLHPDSIVNERNKMTELYYRTADDRSYVEISDNYKKTSEVNLKGRYALMTEGLWRFSDKSGGGPFISYTFYDENSKRIYMLDGSIYAPKYYKKSLIQQVDVTLQSFMTEDELSEDKKEDLLDELD